MYRGSVVNLLSTAPGHRGVRSSSVLGRWYASRQYNCRRRQTHTQCVCVCLCAVCVYVCVCVHLCVYCAGIGQLYVRGWKSCLCDADEVACFQCAWLLRTCTEGTCVIGTVDAHMTGITCGTAL